MAAPGKKQLGKQADQLLPVTAVIVSFFRHEIPQKLISAQTKIKKSTNWKRMKLSFRDMEHTPVMMFVTDCKTVV